jgi:hypothetical protein
MAHGLGAKQTALEEIPLDQIQEQSSAYPRVLVFLKRKSAQGYWSSIAGKTEHDIGELVHPEEWITPLCGGGRYRVEAMDPNDAKVYVVPPFMINIDAAPKPNADIRRTMAVGWSGTATAPATGGQPMYPPFGYPYPPPGFEGSGEPVDPRMYWAQPPDAIAQENTKRMAKELENANAEHKKERDALIGKIDKLMERMADTEKRNSENLAKEREARLEAKIEAMAKGNSSNKGETTAELLKAASMFAPVLVALVASGKDNKQIESQQAQKSQELMLQTISTFTKSSGGFADILKVALPSLAPLVIKMFDERSPSKMAELIGTMGESNLAMFAMVSDMLRNVIPPESDNPWMPVIQQAFDSVRNVAEQMAKVSKPGPAQRLQNVPPMQQMASPTQTNGVAQTNAQAKAIADAICKEPSLEESLRTKEWHEIYYAIHALHSPTDVADMLAARLSDLHDKNALPSFFRGVFEDSTRAPSSFLKPLLDGLPIREEPAYIVELLKAFDATFDSVPAEVVDGP